MGPWRSIKKSILSSFNRSLGSQEDSDLTCMEVKNDELKSNSSSGIMKAENVYPLKKVSASTKDLASEVCSTDFCKLDPISTELSYETRIREPVVATTLQLGPQLRIDEVLAELNILDADSDVHSENSHSLSERSPRRSEKDFAHIAQRQISEINFVHASKIDTSRIQNSSKRESPARALTLKSPNYYERQLLRRRESAAKFQLDFDQTSRDAVRSTSLPYRTTGFAFNCTSAVPSSFGLEQIPHEDSDAVMDLEPKADESYNCLHLSKRFSFPALSQSLSIKRKQFSSVATPRNKTYENTLPQSLDTKSFSKGSHDDFPNSQLAAEFGGPKQILEINAGADQADYDTENLLAQIESVFKKATPSSESLSDVFGSQSESPTQTDYDTNFDQGTTIRIDTSKQEFLKSGLNQVHSVRLELIDDGYTQMTEEDRCEKNSTSSIGSQGKSKSSRKRASAKTVTLKLWSCIGWKRKYAKAFIGSILLSWKPDNAQFKLLLPPVNRTLAIVKNKKINSNAILTFDESETTTKTLAPAKTLPKASTYYGGASQEDLGELHDGSYKTDVTIVRPSSAPANQNYKLEFLDEAFENYSALPLIYKRLSLFAKTHSLDDSAVGALMYMVSSEAK